MMIGKEEERGGEEEKSGVISSEGQRRSSRTRQLDVDRLPEKCLYIHRNMHYFDKKRTSFGLVFTASLRQRERSMEERDS